MFCFIFACFNNCSGIEILPSLSKLRFTLSAKTEVAKISLFSSNGFKESIESESFSILSCVHPSIEELLKHAKIKQNMLFVGQGQTFQIWEPGLFEKFKIQARKKANLNRASLQWDKQFKKESK